MALPFLRYPTLSPGLFPAASLFHTLSISSLNRQDAFHKWSISLTLMVSGLEDLKVKDCYITFSSIPSIIIPLVKTGTAWWKETYNTKTPLQNEEEWKSRVFVGPLRLLIANSYIWIPGMKYLKCFIFLLSLKYLVKKWEQKQRNALNLEKYTMSLSVYTKIFRALIISQCVKANLGNVFSPGCKTKASQDSVWVRKAYEIISYTES